MAKMIPPSIYSQTPSPGEKEIFRRLREDPDTKDWIVLHSLDLAQPVRQIAGEIDFVIIVPAKGVLCLEVKAHTHIRCENGLWYYGSNPHGEVRGPFKQAAEGMHSIHKRLVQLRPDLNSIVFWSAVLLPYTVFKQESVEWHPWQVIDNEAFRSRSISQLVTAVLDEARAFLQGRPTARWFRAYTQEPDPTQCDAIAKTLRPDFEVFEPPAARAERLTSELKHYTTEQFIALDAMETNPRVVFVGPGGTGKTMLALEAARRSRAADRRVLLICYNRLLGRWLEEQARSMKPQVVARTLHSHMLAVVGQSIIPEQDRAPSFWESDLPGLATDQLRKQTGSENVFDELVIDEAPDLMRREYLDFLDLSLKGGLASGRWRMFGDFEKQAIYGAANLTLEDMFNTRTGVIPVFSLRVNCRNTPRIAELVRLLGGLDPGYSKILRPDNGIEAEFHYYENPTEQQTLLIKALQDLHKEGFNGQDMVILSRRGDVACAAAAIQISPWKDRLRPFNAAGSEQIGYGSIHSFKGMEAPAVIVTDVNRITAEDARALFYIAITRALHRLIILVHEPVREEMRQIVLKPLGFQSPATRG